MRNECDEDEINSDKGYLKFCNVYIPHYQMDEHPLKRYKGPSLNMQARKIIKARYGKSLTSNAFPSNIRVSNESEIENTNHHRRREPSIDRSPWETPVPRLGRSNQILPLADRGQVNM